MSVKTALSQIALASEHAKLFSQAHAYLAFACGLALLAHSECIFLVNECGNKSFGFHLFMLDGIA